MIWWGGGSPKNHYLIVFAYYLNYGWMVQSRSWRTEIRKFRRVWKTFSWPWIIPSTWDFHNRNWFYFQTSGILLDLLASLIHPSKWVQMLRLLKFLRIFLCCRILNIVFSLPRLLFFLEFRMVWKVGRLLILSMPPMRANIFLTVRNSLIIRAIWSGIWRWDLGP